MSEKEKEQYKIQTGKNPSYFGKITKEFYDWLNGEKIEEFMRDRSDKEFEERHLEEIYKEDIQISKLEELQREKFDEEKQKEEEILMDLYEKETGKNPITARKTLRKEYLKWKSEALELEQELIKGIIKEKQEEQELIKEIKENKKTGNLKNWLK